MTLLFRIFIMCWIYLPPIFKMPVIHSILFDPTPTVPSTQVELLAKHTNHETEKIERDIMRPKYFDPYAAVDYGIIDKVRVTLSHS
jgi:hypothetical protein